MEKRPDVNEHQVTAPPDESPPPFDPDPELVTLREKSAKQDPKKVWKADHSRARSR